MAAHASVQRMSDLAQQIAEKTKVITDYLTANNLEAASFDVNGLDAFPISPENEEPHRARMDLISLTKELHDISLGPKEKLRYLAWDCVSNLSLHAIWSFRLAEAVPLTGTITYEALSAAASSLNNNLPLPVLNLRRFIRHAITDRIFAEPTKGHVAHTRSSRLLVEDEPLKNWVGFMCNDLFRPLGNVVGAMRKWPASEEPDETSVNLAYGHGTKWFDWLQENQELGKRYNLAMQAHGGGEGYSAALVVSGYPWEELPENSTVVDLGGNQGYISFEIAKAFPSLTFIVQDTAGMRQPSTIGTVPPDLTSCVSLTTHDFFTPQPVTGAAVYFFRMIFHGFADKYCVEILKALVPAMRNGSKVVINDGALPEPGTEGYVEERTMRTLDIFMQVTVNAREREGDDWKELFTRADKRYKFSRMFKPEKARMWFIEAEWVED